MNEEIKISERIHSLFKEFEGKAWCPIGEKQFIYSKKNKEISLISLPDYLGNGKTFWEIYSLKGNTVKEIERFNSKKEAEKRIKELFKKKWI